MSFLSGKHTVIAMLMAPVLGLIGYFGVGAIVGEKPHVAEPGASYELVEKPNCRHASDVCGLKNVDFELILRYEWLENKNMLLLLSSENRLDGVMVAHVENQDDEKEPVAMKPVSNDGLNWSLELQQPDPETNRLRLVASANQTLYFGDAAMKFALGTNDPGNQE